MLFAFVKYKLIELWATQSIAMSIQCMPLIVFVEMIEAASHSCIEEKFDNASGIDDQSACVHNIK